MNTLRTFNDIRMEYPEAIATDVLAVYSIYASMTLKKKDDFIVGEAFKKRLRKKVRKVLFECEESHLDHIIKIALDYPYFPYRQNKSQTLREFVDHDQQWHSPWHQ